MTRRLGWAIIVTAVAAAAVLVASPQTRVRFLAPARSESAFARGVHSLQGGHIAEAERFFRTAVRYQTHTHHLLSRIGLAYLNQFDRHSPDELEEARCLVPSQRTPRQEQALALAEGTARWLSLAARTDRPQSLLLTFRLVNIERQLGRYQQASARLDRLAAEYPDNPMVLNVVGYTYVSEYWPGASDGRARALELLQRAAELRPNDGMILDSLGWAYYKLGHTRTALHWLLKAARLEGSAEIFLHVADVYGSLAERKQQIAWTKRALLTNPNLLEARKRWQAVSVWYYESH